MIEGPYPQNFVTHENYSDIFIFEKFRISRVTSGKSLSLPGICRVRISAKITRYFSRNSFRNNFVSEGMRKMKE